MPDNASSTTGDKTVPASDTFVMGLDSWIGGTPVLLALSREYNKDYSLSLETKYITNDRDRITALKDGTIQVTEMTLACFPEIPAGVSGFGSYHWHYRLFSWSRWNNCQGRHQYTQ